VSTRLVVLLVTLGVVLFGGWFFTTHERVTEAEFTGYTGAARYNELLAAEMLLREVGYEAESRASLSPAEWLPDTADTIVARLAAPLGTIENGPALVSWLAQGGHLVLLPPHELTNATDTYLAQFGFRYVVRDDSTVDADDAGDDANDDDPGTDTDYELDLDQTRYRIQILHDEDGVATLYDQHGIVVARRAFNDGYITAIAGPYLHNSLLGEADHGRLLLDVVAGSLAPGKVWLFYDEAFPALWQLIASNAPYVVGAAAVLLLLWLWAVIPRFGPGVAEMPDTRRSIIEHIDATAAFSWRHRSDDVLMKSAVEELLQAAERRHPGLGRLSLDKQARRLAAMTGRSPQKILDALSADADHRPRDFLHQIRILQSIRNDL